MSSEQVQRAKRELADRIFRRSCELSGGKLKLPATLYKCPHCGWLYDPTKTAKGTFIIAGKVPIHSELGPSSLTSYCPGVGQEPRNAESDNRPLWNEEQQ